MQKVCKEREAALNLTMDRVLADAKEAMELAFEMGDIPATVHYANEINEFEDIISRYVEMYTEDPDLIDA